MAPHNLHYATASTLARMIRGREITSREVTAACFDMIGQLNKRYNALVTLNREDALVRATEADRAVAEGRSLGPLHGVPVTIKDNYRTKGCGPPPGTKA